MDGRYAIRRLGALLLAKRLDDFPDLARKVPRVVVYTGISKLETRLDQTGTKGYAVGFQGLVRFVMGQLPQNEVIEDALRKEVSWCPRSQSASLVANALIHQDLRDERSLSDGGDIQQPRRDLEPGRAGSAGRAVH